MKRTFKTGIWVQNDLVIVLWFHNGYFVVKKLVWNVCIKALWYANDVKLCTYYSYKLFILVLFFIVNIKRILTSASYVPHENFFSRGKFRRGGRGRAHMLSLIWLIRFFNVLIFPFLLKKGVILFQCRQGGLQSWFS